ncbi:hypothetical protein U2084_14885, partial [Listeria monocytogenes]|uniref:hypothetical protein n=1 Tax=Listeria monocytogenes TaxID=1639 RepID=UPI002FDBC0E5
ALIDGTLTINTPYTIWRDLEFAQTGLARQSAQSGSVPNDITIAHGVDIHAIGTKIINCVIHDAVGNGIGLWSDASGSEIYGNVIYYNGW